MHVVPASPSELGTRLIVIDASVRIGIATQAPLDLARATERAVRCILTLAGVREAIAVPAQEVASPHASAPHTRALLI
jgi:hypothetical protein